MKFAIVTLSLLATLVSGLAVPDVAARQATQTITPNLAVTIREVTPNTPDGPVATGIVNRENGQRNVQTLLSYNIPALPGKTCTISFSNPIILTGTGRIQIFDVGGPVTAANTFNTRPFRNNYRCVLVLKPAGQGPATIQDNVSCVFPCPQNPTTLGLETVPSGDSVSVSWDVANAGLVILVS